MSSLKCFVMVSLQLNYANDNLLELFFKMQCSTLSYGIWDVSCNERHIWCLWPVGDNLRNKPISDSI